MPNRIIRENILTSDAVCSLKWDEEVFYRRLMSVVDDYGRFENRPELLRAKCYPLQVDQVRVADITRWIAACVKAGILLEYCVDGRRYLQITKFGQQIRTASKYPDPPSNDGALISNDIKCYQSPTNEHLGVSVSVSVIEDEVDKDEKPEVVKEWNLIEGVTHCKSLTKSRRDSLNARLKETFFLENWKEALEKIKVSRFCNGINDRKWKADFDWFLRPDTIAKIIEGKYDNKFPAKRSMPTSEEVLKTL
jgi:hypothetical protein